VRSGDAASGGWKRFWGYVAGGAVGAVLCFGPFIWYAWPSVRFGLIDYHAGREAGDGFAALAYKGGFLLRLAGNYLPALMGVLVLVVAKILKVGHSVGERSSAVLWGGIGAMTLLHLAAPFPYDDYQVIVYPLLCVVVAIGLVDICGCPAASVAALRYRVLGLVVAFVVCLHGVSGPILQGWFVGPRDRIWWPLKEETPVQQLRRVARELAADGAQRGEILLTQDAYLAVECGMRLPHGLALGPFSLFPALSTPEARQLHVVNLELLSAELAAARPEFAAFSGYGLAIGCPGVTELPIDVQRQLWETVSDRYREVRQEEFFGQAYTTLRLMQKRGVSEESK
jgi:hypothetical protein